MWRPPGLAHFVALFLASRRVLLDDLLELFGLGELVFALLFEVELREHLGVSAEDDVGAATGHVRRDGDGAFATRLRDDERFLLVVLRVEHGMRHRALLQDARDGRRLLDARRADEHRLAALVELENFFDDRGELLALRFVDEVVAVFSHDGFVRRDLHDRELVRRVELGGLGVGGAGHARELLVDAEEILERDRRHRPRLFLDGTPSLASTAW